MNAIDERLIDYDDMAEVLHISRDEIDKLVAGMTRADINKYPPAIEYIDAILQQSNK